MKISEKIAKTIDRLGKGYVFTYQDISAEVNQKQAVIKALNRLVSAGKLAKAGKGKFYKPEQSPFGTLAPSQYQVVKDLLGEAGKPTGYLTGLSIYHQLGLTTQISHTIQIGKNEIRPTFLRESYKIKFIKQKNRITKENVPLLQILDALRYIKKIPDTDLETACKRFLAILKDLSEKEQTRLGALALAYPPATRALLGACLDELNLPTQNLLKTLNPLTTYTLSGAEKILTHTKKWYIL